MKREAPHISATKVHFTMSKTGTSAEGSLEPSHRKMNAPATAIKVPTVLNFYTEDVHCEVTSAHKYSK